MKILKVIKNEVKENWGYMIGAVIACLITQKRAEKYTRRHIEMDLSKYYLNDATVGTLDGIYLDQDMTYHELMEYLYFKHTTRPNKKKRIEYLKEKGFID